MGKRVVNINELSKLMRNGAQVEVEREESGPQEVIIEGLIAQLEAIANRRDEELIAALQALGAQSPTGTDLTPLIEALKPRPPVAYEFDIDRNNRGQITKILATPVE